MEVPGTLIQSGWIAIPLMLISIFNLSIFIYSIGKMIRLKNNLSSDLWETSFLFQNFEKEKSSPTMGLELKKDLLYDRWEKEISNILVTVTWIASLASIATLLGLLGTVFGIQESFASMQSQGRTTLDVFAGGVSMALSTTILGLCIAIPSYFLNQILKSELLRVTHLFQSRTSEFFQKV
jgi:biopolymer transport protein ExbB/TolQ